MFRQPAGRADAEKHSNPGEWHAAWKIVLEGLAVGVLTGLVGVGMGIFVLAKEAPRVFTPPAVGGRLCRK